MDFGELGQDADEESIVPTRPFQLATHGTPAPFPPRQIQRQVLRAMPLPVPRPVLVAGHIQRPVQPILNTPMTTHNTVEPFRRARFAQQIIAALLANRAILLMDGDHFAHDKLFDQSQARPVMRFR